MATGTTTRPAGKGSGRRRAAKSPASTIPARVLGVFVLVTLLYLLLAGRLTYLQVFQHTYYREVAEDLRERARRVPARRGVLLDRNGTLLVKNAPAGTIVLDPNLWYARQGGNSVAGDTPEARREAALTGLAAHFPDLDIAALALKASERLPGGPFRRIDVARQVDIAVAERIRAANLPGIGVWPATRRLAINGPLAPHLLGFTDIDGIGLEGLEKGLDPTLRGTPGVLEAEFDTRGRAIPGTVRRDEPPQDGRDVVLTVDAGLQHDVQQALWKAYQKYHAESASAVVLDPRTGDILALANFPAYNVNQRAAVPAASRANRAVTSPFEPGSTLKVITVAAALEAGKISLDSRLFCAGKRRIGRRTIHCSLHYPHERGHGDQSINDVIRLSCNVATAECAFRLGRQTLWEYERRFGLGERTGSGLGGESRGLLSSPESWSDIQLANVAFGQGISVTPLQLAAAYAAIANDGVWMRPRIVRGTRAPDSARVQEVKTEPGRRVIRSDIARALRSMLQSVVEEGTGKAAAPDGYTAGGKTGTAQIARNGSYRNGKYVASFVGMTPMSNPQFVILVAVTAPRGAQYGGVVAAPVFKEIAEKALLARRAPRDKTDDPGKKTERRNTPPSRNA